jgi:4-amino-4-deoxy-L-arabinose transferase-like glycosyltransferase
VLFNKKLLFFLIFALALFLRLFHLGKSPISPYWEEIALGYDAYSISETAKDHHGNFLPLVAFESFGDWKPSLYFYASVPFIKIFGLNIITVRLPTVFASLFIVLGIAVLAKTLFKHFYLKNDGKAADFIFYLALFLASISPWLLTFSRSAWESTLATALILWGLNFWLFFVIENKSKWAILAVFLLGLSTYAYHSARITAPLLGLSLVLLYLQKRKKINWRVMFSSGLLAILLFSPIAFSLFQKTGQQRISEAGIFTDLSIIEKSNELRAAHDNSLWSRIVYHRYLFFAGEVIENFFDHFNFNYLFVSGDNNPRHSIQSFGEFYYLDLLFFLFAALFFLYKRNRVTFFLFFYLFVAILPAAFAKATPHALRTLAALPIFIVFLSFGVWQFLEMFKKAKLKSLVLISLIFAYFVLINLFFYQLIFIYPNKYKSEWQFGYQEMFKKLTAVENNYDQIYITREQGRPAMYYFFYNKINPSLVQAFNNQAKKDQGEFLNFGKIEFIDQTKQISTVKKTLVVSSMDFYKNSFASSNAKIISSTEDQVWVLYEVK